MNQKEINYKSKETRNKKEAFLEMYLAQRKIDLIRHVKFINKLPFSINWEKLVHVATRIL